MRTHYPVLLRLLLPVLLLAASLKGYGQQNMLVNLDLLDGVELTPASIFNFQVVNNSGATHNAMFTGSIRYRGSNLRLGYSFHAALLPGVNNFSRDKVSSPVWSFSDPALKELFMNYGRLPQGSYEYCVSLSLGSPGSESQPSVPIDGCVYNKSNDIFLINLVDPENKAKLYEQYPMLSWAVTSPLASELTYRIRVAELKKGQNAVNAITRNPAMYEERNVMGNSIQYPVTAKPLEKWQPYVWTVDAYYKGLLLGGAETWQFMIVDDSELVAVPKDQTYYEFAGHHGETTIFSVGDMKLKYINDVSSDSLYCDVLDRNKKKIYSCKPVAVKYGDNFFTLDLLDELAHKTHYFMQIRNKRGKEYEVPFVYYNPLFVK